jgi:hypothetical protein
MRKIKARIISAWPDGWVLFLIILLSLPALWTIGCRSFSTFSIDSRMPGRDIVIDGRSDDWAGQTYTIGEGEVSLGFMNDGESLYVCLLSGDKAVRSQIMRGGLTVWLDPNGGEKKTFGIRFPVPAADRKPPEGRTQEPPAEGGKENPNAAMIPGADTAELEIIASENGAPRRLALDDAGGIEVAIEPSSGFLVYELKIPLARSEGHPFSVGAAPGGVVGIGFETGKIDRKKDPRGEGDGRPGEGEMPPMRGGIEGGMNRGRGGLGPGMAPRMEPDLPKDLKLWAFVRLAAGKKDGQAQLLSYLDTYPFFATSSREGAESTGEAPDPTTRPFPPPQ